MAEKKPSIASTPNPNPKLADYLKAGGQSAKPPVAGRSTGSIPQNRRSSGGRKR
jgi:hypothetical protein